MSDTRNDPAAGAFEHVQALLRAIGREQDLDLEIDPDGALLLIAPDDIGIMIEVLADAGIVAVYGAIVPLPDDPPVREALFELTLQRNFVQPLLGGGSIGIDPERAVLAFSSALPVAGLDRRRLGRLIEHAIETVAEIRGLLSGEIGKEPQDDDLQAEPARAGGSSPDLVIKG